MFLNCCGGTKEPKIDIVRLTLREAVRQNGTFKNDRLCSMCMSKHLNRTEKPKPLPESNKSERAFGLVP